MARSLGPERRAQNRLVEGGLMRRIDVAAKQRGGGRRGAREYLYFLSDARKAEAIVAAAKKLGVGDAKKAKDNYMRGGLKGNHTRVRTDFLIRLMLDAAFARELGEDVEVPLEEAWGESCPAFPILGAKITRDDAGRQLDEFEKRKAGYEEIEADGRFRVEWPTHGISCEYDIELEMGTRPEEVSEKIDARAAAWARLHEQHRERVLKAKRDREGNPYARLPDGLFSGFGPEVVPVLFLHPTEQRADNMRRRLLEEHPERYADFAADLAGFDVSPGRLFLFAGLDALLPEGVEGPGRTLGASYWPLELDSNDRPVEEPLSPGKVAAWLADLREPEREV